MLIQHNDEYYPLEGGQPAGRYHSAGKCSLHRDYDRLLFRHAFRNWRRVKLFCSPLQLFKYTACVWNRWEIIQKHESNEICMLT